MGQLGRGLRFSVDLTFPEPEASCTALTDRGTLRLSSPERLHLRMLMVASGRLPSWSAEVQLLNRGPQGGFAV